MDNSETVWVEREYVGHGFRDDDLSRLRTERVVFDECDFRGVNLTESEHAGSAFRDCTFDRAILHHSTFRRQCVEPELTSLSLASSAAADQRCLDMAC